jgi:CRISPR locus-related DNA-binding protein
VIHLTPIGFDPSHIVAGIVEEGISEDDTVLLLTPEANLDEQRFKEARQEVENFLETIGGAQLDTVTVDHTDFGSTTLEISRLIAEQDEPIFLNASQAAREILLPTVVAAIMQRERIDDILLYSDVDRQSLDADLPFPVELTDAHQQILGLLADKTTIGELAEELDIDKSTVSRKITAMEEKHLVQVSREGRTKQISPSFTGKIYRAILQSQ